MIIMIIMIIQGRYLLCCHLRHAAKCKNARVHSGPLKWKSVRARWPPTGRPRCKLDIRVCLQAVIAICIITQPQGWYSFAASQRVESWVDLSTAVVCSLYPKLHISAIFHEKHKNWLQHRFNSGTSRAAVRCENHYSTVTYTYKIVTQLTLLWGNSQSASTDSWTVHKRYIHL